MKRSFRRNAELLPFFFIFFVFLILFLSENPYSLVGALSYSLRLFLYLGFVLTILYLSLKIRYFKSKNCRDALINNFFQIGIITAAYAIFIKFVSISLFQSFEAFISPSKLNFYPEKYFLVLPASIGLLLFFYRLLSNPDLVAMARKNNSSITIPFIEPISIEDLERVRSIFFGLLMGTFVISLFSEFILEINLGSALISLEDTLTMNSLYYGMFFGFLDLLIGVSLSKTSNNVYPYPWGWKNIKDKLANYTQFIKKYPKRALVLLILLILLFSLGIYTVNNTLKIINEPYQIETITITAYEIHLNISEILPHNATIIKSDDSFVLNNESLTVAIPLVEINGNLYPLSTRLIEKEGIIKYKKTPLYLIEDISPILINFTYYDKGKLIEHFDEEKIYYQSLRVDSYLFLGLVLNGYNNVISYSSEDLLRIPKTNKNPPEFLNDIARKVYFSKNSKSEIGGHVIDTSLYLITLDIETAQVVKKISEMNEEVYVSIKEDEITSKQLFSHLGSVE